MLDASETLIRWTRLLLFCSESPDLSPAEIAAMSRSERAALAAQYKSKGNAAYQKRDFTRAIDLYSKAIAVAAVPEAVFYSNRAACTCRGISGSYRQAMTLPRPCFQAT